MSMAARGTLRSGLMIIGVVGLIVALTTPVRGQVADNKTFTVDIDGTGTTAAPDVHAGDADAGISIVITNTSANQDLNSANVTVPAPCVVLSSGSDDDAVDGGPVVELRNLGITPGSTRTYAVAVDVQTCTPSNPPAFPVAAKQSNTFNGTGNDFFLNIAASDVTVDVAGTCGLAFVAQPGDAEDAPTIITSVDYDPQGPPISVEVRDAGDTGRATHATPTIGLTATNVEVAAPLLGGTTSATAAGGLATFAPGPTLTPSAFDYQLVATTDFDGDGSADATTVSDPFDIVDDQVACPAGEPCATPATAQRGRQTMTVTLDQAAATSEATSLAVSLGAEDVPDFDCEGVPGPDVRFTAQYFLVGTSDEGRTGTIELTVPDASRPLNVYEVCWAAPYQFPTDGGGDAELDESVQYTKPGAEESSGLYVGVLPDCARRGEPARPCVSDRTFNKTQAMATIVIQTDGRDPWART
jgi:hypothetical protein